MKPGTLAAVLAVLTLAACREGEPIEPGFTNPREAITRVVLKLVEYDAVGIATGDTLIVTGTNTGGNGGVPVIDTLHLMNLHLYQGTVEVWNDLSSVNITPEIAQEAESHQFFYTPQGGVATRVIPLVTDHESDYVDNKGMDFPVGLMYNLTATSGPPASGFLNIALGHYTDIPKNGIDPGNESDVEIDFPVIVE